MNAPLRSTRHRPLFLALALFAGLSLPQAASASSGGKENGVDFEALSDGFAETHCKGSLACDLEQVLARDFLELRLGVFELYFPRTALSGRGQVKGLGELTGGLVDLQTHLLAWLSLPPEAATGLAADFHTVKTWIEGWSTSALGKAAKSDSTSLLEALGADSSVRAAAQRLGPAMVDRATLGLAPQYVDNVRIVIAPTRLEFMEWIGFLGQGDKAWATQHWVEGADQWTQFWQGPTMFLALEYAPWTGFDPNFKSALSPERLGRDGARQHFLNQAARALLFRLFNQPELAHLERGLAANLVIEVTGSIAVLDGEGEIRSSGGQAAPYSRFVPGGQSEGGVLPPASAAGMDAIVKSRWRKHGGEDFFVEALRDGQKEGAKLAAKDRKNPRRDDPLVHFAIDSDLRGAKWVAHAPFLGPFASEQAYPEGEFLNDYREFFKSYQAAFYHWLATEAEPGAEGSQAPFAGFLRGLAKPDFQGDRDALLEEQYGLPVSARDATVDSLEWRFLAWLAESKK